MSGGLGISWPGEVRMLPPMAQQAVSSSGMARGAEESKHVGRSERQTRVRGRRRQLGESSPERGLGKGVRGLDQLRDKAGLLPAELACSEATLSS